MMKKLLLGSTALVAGGLMAAPAMANDPIRMGVGGYWTGYAIGGAIDPVYSMNNGAVTNFRGLNFIHEGEIHFIGQTKLANGTTIGLVVEIEANHAGGAVGLHTDETFAFASGNWGRIEFGSRDPGSYRMYWGTPSALIGFGFFQHNHNWAVSAGANKAFRSGIATTIAPQIQESNRINYFTPRFQGLQLGIGYAPKVASAATSVVGVGVCGNAGSGNNPVFCISRDNSYTDMIDIGANYLNKFGDVNVALFGAFMYASLDTSNVIAAGAYNINTGFKLDAWKQWVVGAQFGFALGGGTLTVGGAVGWDNNGIGGNMYTGVGDDTMFYSAGLMYATGPWQMSVGWAGFRNTNGNGNTQITSAANAALANQAAAGTFAAAFNNTGTLASQAAGALSFGQHTLDYIEVGLTYALGPGIRLTSGGVYYAASGPNSMAESDAWGIMLGLDLRF